MFEYGDPDIAKIASDLHGLIQPSGVGIFRAVSGDSGSILKVFTHTGKLVGAEIEQTMISGNTIGNLVVETNHEIIVDDTLVHPLFKDSAAVSQMGIMAYIGVPCRIDGVAFGGISAVNQHRRQWTSEEVQAVRDSAVLVERLALQRLNALKSDDDHAH
ncbi:GAF domain-containing protein [Celeribacter sp. ULVN23_4]